MIFFTYAFVNMGMVSGILPVVGVPLPFISYGGTAMVTLGMGLGILMSIAKESQVDGVVSLAAAGRLQSKPCITSAGLQCRRLEQGWAPGGVVLRSYARKLKHKTKLIVFRFRNLRKETFACPVCGYRGPFMDLAPPTGLRKHAQCPNCNALERHRIQFLVVNETIRQEYNFLEDASLCS